MYSSGDANRRRRILRSGADNNRQRLATAAIITQLALAISTARSWCTSR